MSLFVVSKTRFDVRRLRFILENRVSKKLIKSLLEDREGVATIDRLLDDYINGTVSKRDRIVYYAFFKILDMVRMSFNRTEDVFKEELKNITIRKVFLNGLKSIKNFGFTVPQSFDSPVMVVWNYTNNCNLRCKHCYQDAGVMGSRMGKRELTTEERKRVVDELSRYDIPSIFFSGGEPLIEKDFLEVARYAKSKGFYLTIASNGTLITKDMARKLADIGFGYIQVSIDAATPEKHDEFRGVKGMWERAVQGIKNLNEVGLTPVIAYTHTKDTHNEFRGILELRKKIGAYKVVVYNYIPVGRGDIENDPTPQMREEIMKIMYDELQNEHHVLATTNPVFGAYCKMNGASSAILAHYADLRVKELGAIADVIGGCGAGRAYVAIQPDGGVTPCVYMPNLVVGNLMEQSLGEIWKDSPIMKQLRAREDIKGACATCEYQAVCGGCRARAYSYFGDLMGPDPGCMLNLKYYEEKQKELSNNRKKEELIDKHLLKVG